MIAVRHSSVVAVALAALALSACQSTPKPETTPTVRVAVGDFVPASPPAAVQLDSGRYPNLFAPTSYAVWITNGVAEAKLQRERATGAEISPMLATDASAINANFYVIELNLESVFPDASIAYDVVGMRAINAYLTLPDGTTVQPAQRVMATTAGEQQEGTLRRYGRTNVIVFPKTDVLSGAPTIPAGTQGLRLTLDGFNSIFHFEWTAGPDSAAAPVLEEQSGGLTWSSLYTKLRELSRLTQ